MDDLISRQAAIDAILAVTGNSSVRELYEHVQEHGLSEMWSGGVNAAIDIIIAVPSAQSDITDDQAIEHLQASGWMQSHDKQMYEMGLKERLADDSDSYDALLPSAQPDLSEYSDKLWRNAYERGKEEARIQKMQDLEQAEIQKAYELGKLDAMEEIVRCKDCKHYKALDYTDKLACHYVIDCTVIRNLDDFCSRAERIKND